MQNTQPNPHTDCCCHQKGEELAHLIMLSKEGGLVQRFFSFAFGFFLFLISISLLRPSNFNSRCLPLFVRAFPIQFVLFPSNLCTFAHTLERAGSATNDACLGPLLPYFMLPFGVYAFFCTVSSVFFSTLRFSWNLFGLVFLHHIFATPNVPALPLTRFGRYTTVGVFFPVLA